jgi:tRNA(fMet)-specific endonuclease VapC
MLWILDTDHISLFQRGNSMVIRKVQSIAHQEIAVTIVSYEEQIRGWLKIISRSSSDYDQLTFGYAKLNETLDFYSAKTVLDFNTAAVNQFQQLLRQKIRVGTQDLRIASIALSVDGTVVTRNQRDFQRVPGLKIADWSIVE